MALANCKAKFVAFPDYRQPEAWSNHETQTTGSPDSRAQLAGMSNQGALTAALP